MIKLRKQCLASLKGLSGCQMLLCLVLLRANWTQFDTEKKLMNACVLCKSVVRSIELGKKLEIAENSYCADHIDDPICEFVEALKEDTESTFNESIPKSACSVIGPCMWRPPPHLMGPMCGQCLSVGKFILMANPDQRYKLFDRFCETASGGLLATCKTLKSVSQGLMESLFNVAHSAGDLCDIAGLCMDQRKMEVKIRRKQRIALKNMVKKGKSAKHLRDEL